MSRATDMTEGSPTKHIIKFAFPLLLTNLGQQLYMIVDAAIVGRGVGVKALASVGATDWIYWLILWAVIGLTQGFATFVSRYFGDRNYNDMNKVIAMSTILCAIISVVFTVAGILSSLPLLRLLNTPKDIIGGANAYLIVMIAGTPIITAYNMSGAILRAFGDGKSPLAAMLIAGALNIILDCLFVFVFGWGILGAACATILAQLVSFLFCLSRIKEINYIYFERSTWKIDLRMIKDLLVFGLPLSAEYIVISVGGIILQSSVNLQGSVFIAGYTATNKVYGLLECSGTALGLACTTFLSQNYGAGLYDRVKKGVRISMRIIIIMAVLVFALVTFIKKYLLQLFLNVNEAGGPEALETALRYLSIMVAFLIILYLIHVYRNALQAIGNSFWSMVSGVAECICRVFMAKVVIHWMGSDALFVSEPVAWLGALLCVAIPYYYYQKKLFSPEKSHI